jgi:hypothetical protein
VGGLHSGVAGQESAADEGCPEVRGNPLRHLPQQCLHLAWMALGARRLHRGKILGSIICAGHGLQGVDGCRKEARAAPCRWEGSLDCALWSVDHNLLQVRIGWAKLQCMLEQVCESSRPSSIALDASIQQQR